MSKMVLKIGVIGLGDISNIHLPAIEQNKNARLVAVCDIDETQNNNVAVPFYTDYLLMLEETELDCVHICLPHHLHYPVTKVVVEKGIHVILEEPLAHNLSDSRAIVELEKNHPNVKICI